METEWLKELRRARGMTVRDLAEATGVASSSISQIENGKRKPRAKTKKILANALSVPVSELFKDSTPIEDVALPHGVYTGFNSAPYEVKEEARVLMGILSDLYCMERGKGKDPEEAIEYASMTLLRNVPEYAEYIVGL